MILQNIWNNLFHNLEHNYDAENSLQIFILAALGQNLEAESLKALLEDLNTIIISVAPVTGNIKILHSLTNIGGTRARPKDKNVDLYGGGPSAHPLFVQKSSVLQIFELDFPTMATLKSVTDESVVVNLYPSGGTPTKLNQLTVIILPPLLANNILEIQNMEVCLIIL